MPRRRVLMLILDTYTPAIGERMMAAGALPALTRLAARSARFRLDHGAGLETGLHGEHMSTGLAPDATGRHSAVHFDPARYAVWQEGATLAPFPAALDARTVVFDPTYFDLGRAPGVRGLVGWGAHDPGGPSAARPAELAAEIDARFGPYPASDWTYASPWASAARMGAMAEALEQAADRRAAVAAWLLGERLPDWELAIVTAHELHSVSEAMWHGLDAAHPLHAMPSAAPAGAAYRTVYAAIDRLVGRLVGAFPEAAVIVWCLHGMGPNRSDVPSMLLLSELLCRHQLGSGLLDVPADWAAAPNGIAMLGERETWEQAVSRAMRRQAQPESPWPGERAEMTPLAIDWMPAAQYREFWPEMRAFALPSYLGGRVRINLEGREAQGKVAPGSYGAACDAVEFLLRRCRDARTGEPIVDGIERCARDPAALAPTAADMVIHWRGVPAGIDHPRLGRIGPVPYRRTGGHTGGHGFAYVAGTPLAPGDYGLRSVFDVVPTVFDLLGARRPWALSGATLLNGAAAAQPWPNP